MTKNLEIVQKNSGGGTNSSLTKRLLSVALSAVMMFVMVGVMPKIEVNAKPAVWNGTYDVNWYDGELSTFHISTAKELAGLAYLVNNGKTMSNKTIILDSDVILNDISKYGSWSSSYKPANNWTPIGISESRCFRGTFDGGGHVITGLYCYTELSASNYSTKVAGLFGYLASSGIIKNISCEYNYVYTRNELPNNSYTGGICGSSYGKISNCINKGYVYTYASYDSRPVSSGGICGCTFDNFSIENCYNQGQVGISAGDLNHYCGGILGFYFDTNINGGYIREITNVYNTGVISDGKFSGGILGAPNGSGLTLSNCYYLISSSSVGVGGSSGVDAISKSSTGMRSEDFVRSLGDAFAYNPNGYPMLAWEMNNISAEFNKNYINLTRVGEKAELKLTTNYSGAPIWISSDTMVATVENGVVTAVSSGTATIYAICGDIQATCTVEVDLSSEISLDYDNITMGVGETFILKTLNYNDTCTWLSSDTRIAKISSDGVITAVANGETVIYAILSNGKTLSCNVSVTEKTMTIADVVSLQKFLAKQLSVVPSTADCNGDGKINVLDLIMLKRLIIN